MMSWCWSVNQCSIFAPHKWWKDLSQSIHHCILCCLCCSAMCWMLQGVDYMEASSVLYVKVGMFDQLDQIQIRVLTVTSLGIVMLTVQHKLIVSLCFMQHPWDVLIQISTDILSVKQFPCHIYPIRHFSCSSLQWVPVNKQTSSVQLTANHSTIGISWNLQLYAVGFVFCRMC